MTSSARDTFSGWRPVLPWCDACLFGLCQCAHRQPSHQMRLIIFVFGCVCVTAWRKHICYIYGCTVTQCTRTTNTVEWHLHLNICKWADVAPSSLSDFDTTTIPFSLLFFSFLFSCTVPAFGAPWVVWRTENDPSVDKQTNERHMNWVCVCVEMNLENSKTDIRRKSIRGSGRTIHTALLLYLPSNNISMTKSEVTEVNIKSVASAFQYIKHDQIGESGCAHLPPSPPPTTTLRLSKMDKIVIVYETNGGGLVWPLNDSNAKTLFKHSHLMLIYMCI